MPDEIGLAGVGKKLLEQFFGFAERGFRWR